MLARLYWRSHVRQLSRPTARYKFLDAHITLRSYSEEIGNVSIGKDSFVKNLTLMYKLQMLQISKTANMLKCPMKFY